MGTVVGVLAGMVGGGYTAYVAADSGAGTAIFLGIASAGAVGGYDAVERSINTRP